MRERRSGTWSREKFTKEHEDNGLTNRNISTRPRRVPTFLYQGLRFLVDRDDRDPPSSYVAVHRSVVRIDATPSPPRILTEPPVAYNVVEIILEVDELSLELAN